MKTTITPLERYKEEDHKKYLNIVTLGHLLLGLFLLMPDVGAWATNYHAQLCFFISLSFLIANKYHDWEDHSINLVFIYTYTALVLCEYWHLGIPGLDNMHYTNPNIGPPNKGALTEIFLFTLPALYVCLRVCLLAPIVMMSRWKNRH